MMQLHNKVLFLMGPTCAGKTALVSELYRRMPIEIISVDSAQIYRGLDIGTAKLSAVELQQTPHHLIDICDPWEAYSVSAFCEDALRLMRVAQQQGRLPVLVGGTMMYFHALLRGLSPLPPQDPNVRAAIHQRLQLEGLEALYADLCQQDPVLAKRIHANDTQRIQRALEIVAVTGHPASYWYDKPLVSPLQGWEVISVALAPQIRQTLRPLITERFETMLRQGLVEEVEGLRQLPGVSETRPAMRSIGYRQVWAYLTKRLSYKEMCDQAIWATCQLAKRQYTWLRSWPDLYWLESHGQQLVEAVIQQIAP